MAGRTFETAEANALLLKRITQASNQRKAPGHTGQPRRQRAINDRLDRVAQHTVWPHTAHEPPQAVQRLQVCHRVGARAPQSHVVHHHALGLSNGFGEHNLTGN